ncbi:putative cytochrome P450 monooxygenase [Cyathus striatus]|nr:putative cytochrome P450 monooxygenase [Cyathus striatus]
MEFTVAFASLVLISLIIVRLRAYGRREQGLPPGPDGIPILGNALQFPTAFPHLMFTQWAREYGEIYSLKIFSRNAIVLTSPEAIKEILDVKGSVTGNRPHSYLVEKVTDGLVLALENMTTNIWKRGRKTLHSFLTSEALRKHHQTQEMESVLLLHDILENPKDIFIHIRRLTASTMFSLVYGQQFPKYHNSAPEAYFEGIKLLNQAVDPGAHPPIDVFPFLKLLPGKWKEMCNKAKIVRDGVYGSLLKTCEEQLRDGKGGECFLAKVISEREKRGLEWKEIYGVGAVLMDAGAETTASYLQCIVMSLITFPECQKKARDEIEEVIGDRMPTLDDFDNLPYLKALLKEVIRFTPILPVAVPHVSTEEVTYKDYIIPKGSIIFMNTWGVYHDPELFPNPDAFIPERHFTSGNKAELKVRENLIFGAGRVSVALILSQARFNNIHLDAKRLCPGEPIAMQVVPLNVMKLLWAYTFEKDDSGTGTIGMDAFAKPGIALTPLPFTCKIEARSEKRTAMIKEMFLASSRAALTA